MARKKKSAVYVPVTSKAEHPSINDLTNWKVLPLPSQFLGLEVNERTRTIRRGGKGVSLDESQRAIYS
jgi:hypothetical protein